MGLSIVLPLQDRRSVEGIEELRELLERIEELQLHHPPVLVDHSYAELTTAGVGEVDLDAAEHEARARAEHDRVLDSLGLDRVDRRPTGRPLAPIDQDGERVDREPAPALVYSLDVQRELLRIRDERAASVGLDRFEIRRPERFRDHAEENVSEIGGDLAEAAAELGIELDVAHEPDAALVADGYGPRIRLVDEDGSRVGAEPAPELVYSLDVQRELSRIRDERAASVGLDRFEIRRPERFRDHAEEIAHHRSIELLRIASSPIAGRDGWRRTPDGREWYSAEWLGAIA